MAKKKWITCTHCSGYGVIYERKEGSVGIPGIAQTSGWVETRKKCPTCKGKGEIKVDDND